jgi:hypothetical protein
MPNGSRRCTRQGAPDAFALRGDVAKVSDEKLSRTCLRTAKKKTI